MPTTRITEPMRHVMICLTMVTLGSVSAQDVGVVKYTELASQMKGGSGLTVINFWATWCGPCIKELPYFEEANQMKDVKVLLVSLDFIQDLPKVEKFVGKKALKSEVLLLDEKDYDSYMGAVDESWSGAIPATLIIDRSGKRHFYEQAFERQELFAKINKFID